MFQNQNVSFTLLHTVRTDSLKYRPSKYKLQNLLRSYFQEELVENSKLANNSAVISPISPKSSLSIKFLAFNTILSHPEIINIIRKMENLHPILILYNRFRSDYFFYSKAPIAENSDVQAYFDSAQRSLLSRNSSAKLKETHDNYRVLKCLSNMNDSKPTDSYFTFWFYFFSWILFRNFPVIKNKF